MVSYLGGLVGWDWEFGEIGRGCNLGWIGKDFLEFDCILRYLRWNE